MNLPQFSRRQILVLSAHQIVIGKELDVSLGDFQTAFSYIFAGEEVGIRQHIVLNQLADNLVREWTAQARDDIETVELCMLSVVIWILRRCDAVGHTEADIDSGIWTSANDDSLLVFWRELDVGW